jgi:hypothetical protein
MKRFACILVLQGCLVLLAAEHLLAVNVEAALTLSRPEEVQKRIVDWITERGGTFIIWSRDRLSLRLPVGKIGEFQAWLKTLPGVLEGMTQTANDVGERIAALRAQIRSRTEAMQKNLDIMGRTNVVNTLDIEKEITALITEIEARRGELRFLEYQARFAGIALSLHFKKTTRPENGGSAFPALRRLDLYEFLAQMRDRYEKQN